jgi:indole-3-glycerol phosphate synthase
VLVEVGDAEGARAAAEQGAEALVLRAPARLRDATALPIVLYGAELDDEADAVVIDARAGDPDSLARMVGHAGERGLECVLKVRHEDDLEQALELFDPEIVLLSADEAEDGQPQLERLLELLPDVPAGKLSIAELARPTRGDVAELERAGVDAVFVGAGDVGGLVDDPPPDV